MICGTNICCKFHLVWDYVARADNLFAMFSLSIMCNGPRWPVSLVDQEIMYLKGLQNRYHAKS